MARLLQCNTCTSLERLPDYNGPHEADGALQHALLPHRFPDGEKHLGMLYRGVPEAALDNMGARDEIQRAIWKEKANLATFKDTLLEDAALCYSKHQRPKLGCMDYKDDSKRLGTPTTRSQAAGKIFLCDFCVVHSFVTSQIMAKEIDVRVQPPRRRTRRNRSRR
jgi:hypothetical protein